MKRIIIITILSLSFSFAALAQDGASLGLNEIEQNYLLEKNKEFSITHNKLVDYLNQYTQWFDRAYTPSQGSKYEGYANRIERALSELKQFENGVQTIKIVESENIFILYFPSTGLRLSSALVDMPLSDDELLALLASTITSSEHGNILEVLNIAVVYALDNHQDAEKKLRFKSTTEETRLEDMELYQINEHVLSARYTSDIYQKADEIVYKTIVEVGKNPNSLVSLLHRVGQMQQQDDLDAFQYRQFFSLFYDAENRAIRLQDLFLEGLQ